MSTASNVSTQASAVELIKALQALTGGLAQGVAAGLTESERVYQALVTGANGGDEAFARAVGEVYAGLRRPSRVEVRRLAGVVAPRTQFTVETVEVALLCQLQHRSWSKAAAAMSEVMRERGHRYWYYTPEANTVKRWVLLAIEAEPRFARAFLPLDVASRTSGDPDA